MESEMSTTEPNVERLFAAHKLLATDPPRAIDELKGLAEQGSALAPLYLGWACQKGNEVPQDLAQAEDWFTVALNRGNIVSTYYLGRLYSNVGRHAEASAVFEQGAKLGYLPSIFCLAMNVLEGKAGPSNIDRAKQLLQTAAGQGHVFAQRTLATLYLSGRFGLNNAVYGLWLLGRAVVAGAFIAIRNSDDDRLKA